MKKTVFMPLELSAILTELTFNHEELNGVLFYRPENNKCYVEYLYLTGIGDLAHAPPNEERLDVANEFLRQNPDYKFIQFHTHSIKTIERFPSVAKDFSGGDVSVIENLIEDYPEYLHLLVTPKVRKLYGNHKLIEIKESEQYEKMETIINKALRNIVKKKGYAFEINKI